MGAVPELTILDIATLGPRPLLVNEKALSSFKKKALFGLLQLAHFLAENANP